MSRFAMFLGLIALAVALAWQTGPHNPYPVLAAIVGVVLLLIGGIGEMLARARRKKGGGYR